MRGRFDRYKPCLGGVIHLRLCKVCLLFWDRRVMCRPDLDVVFSVCARGEMGLGVSERGLGMGERSRVVCAIAS
jgi:hypothetical protein